MICSQTAHHFWRSCADPGVPPDERDMMLEKPSRQVVFFTDHYKTTRMA